MKGHEAIKYLCENPKAKFRDNVGREIHVTENGKIKVKSCAGLTHPTLLQLQQDGWQLVQQSVTLDEALDRKDVDK